MFLSWTNNDPGEALVVCPSYHFSVELQIGETLVGWDGEKF